MTKQKTRFHALNVSGESFLLVTTYMDKPFCVLMDAGHKPDKDKPNPLVNAIKAAEPKLNKIDVAICSHQDSDHAGGYPAFIDAWYAEKRKIGALWLPARWSVVDRDMLENPERFLENIRIGAQDFLRNLDDGLLEIASRAYSKSEKKDFEETLRTERNLDIANAPLREAAPANTSDTGEFLVNENDESERLVEESPTLNEAEFDRLATIAFNNTLPSNIIIFDKTHIVHQSNWSLPLASFVGEVFDTAKSIRAIAVAADAYKIKIQYFDFSKFETTKKPSGGKKNFLVPVNAVEIRPSRRKFSGSLLDARTQFLNLALSRHNMESLVVCKVEHDNEPAVLFTADSWLNFKLSNPDPEQNFPFTVPKFIKRPLITAPHHGSKTNDHAYGVINGWLDNISPYYVRNGGHSNIELHAYQGLNDTACVQDREKCEKCKPGNDPQEITIVTKAGVWDWPPYVGDPCK